MMISYKYPIFPSNTTQWKLAENLDACRWLYNRLLQDLNEAKRKGIKLKTYDSQNMIPSLKLINPKLNLVYSKVLQMVNYTLWSNIKGLSTSKKNGRKIGHIRFKGYGWYNTLNYNQSKIYRKIEGCIKAVIKSLSCIKESTANETISCISSLGCMSIALISSALKILMSKV